MQSRRDMLMYGGLMPFAAGLFPLATYSEQAGTGTGPTWLKDIATQLQREFNLPAVWVATEINGVVEAAVVGVKKTG